MLSIQTKAQTLKYGFLVGIDAMDNFLVNSNKTVGANGAFASFNINGYLGYNLNPKFGLSIEPGYIQKGIYNFKLNYIQVPTLFDYYVTDKFFVNIGPEFAYLLNSSNIFDNRFEISGMIGLNYNFYKNFDLGLSYSRAFTHYMSGGIINNINESPNDISYFYNNYLQLKVRVKL